MNGEALPRVAVTRDEDLDGALGRALRNEGLEPVLCQAVRTLPPDTPTLLEAAARSLEQYDWLVAASRRAVDAIVEARRGKPLPAALRTAAVGESTAAALRSAGARYVLVGDESGAEALLSLLVGADAWHGHSVLVPRAAEGRRLIAETLSAWGARVEEVEAYRTVPCTAREIVERWSFSHPVAAVITSPSAAEALVGALGPACLRRLDAVVAIGPTTAGTLATLGVAALISPRADFASVAQRTRHALEELARQRELFQRRHSPRAARPVWSQRSRPSWDGAQT